VGGVAGSVCGYLVQVSFSVMDELNTKHADLLRVLEKRSCMLSLRSNNFQVGDVNCRGFEENDTRFRGSVRVKNVQE
jgi:hypothetical protein